jgi:Ca2+/Na+ antiporter
MSDASAYCIAFLVLNGLLALQFLVFIAVRLTKLWEKEKEDAEKSFENMYAKIKAKRRLAKFWFVSLIVLLIFFSAFFIALLVRIIIELAKDGGYKKTD